MGEKNGEVSIEEVSLGIVGSEELTDIDWLSLADEEEESKEVWTETQKAIRKTTKFITSPQGSRFDPPSPSFIC